MKRLCINYAIPFLLALLFVNSARADLMFYPIDLDSGGTAIFIEGKFSYNDDLTAFKKMVNSPDVKFVSFNSVGGNVEKAMELGRTIRQAGKNTIQIRRNNCESACALAFYGGVYRGAQAGSIGVHRSSLPSDIDITTQGAVESVQIHIARTTAYMIEMGIDPALLELTLQYGSDDIRYLSNSEMQKYSVTTTNKQEEDKRYAKRSRQENNKKATRTIEPALSNDLLKIPQATNGYVRHAKGSVPLKSRANRNSANIATIKNGDQVKILTDKRPWYKVQYRGRTGYMHVTWLWVKNYEATNFDYLRFIQIKSFDNLADAEKFVRTTSLPVEAYLASNNWFSIVLDKRYMLDDALNMVQTLKKNEIIPSDSFATLGNTYVRKVCCN